MSPNTKVVFVLLLKKKMHNVEWSIVYVITHRHKMNHINPNFELILWYFVYKKDSKNLPVVNRKLLLTYKTRESRMLSWLCASFSIEFVRTSKMRTLRSLLLTAMVFASYDQQIDWIVLVASLFSDVIKIINHI